MKVIYTASEMDAYIDMMVNVSKLAECKKQMNKKDLIKEMMNVKEVAIDNQGNWVIDIPEEKFIKVVKLLNNNAATIITIFQSIFSLLKVMKTNIKTMMADMDSIFKD